MVSMASSREAPFFDRGLDVEDYAVVTTHRDGDAKGDALKSSFVRVYLKRG